MRNGHLREANDISLPVPNNTAAGAPVRVGGLNAVTKTATGPAGEPGLSGNLTGYASVALQGSATFTFAGAGNPGDPVYITTGNALSMTATGNTIWGHLLETKASGTNAARVRVSN